MDPLTSILTKTISRISPASGDLQPQLHGSEVRDDGQSGLPVPGSSSASGHLEQDAGRKVRKLPPSLPPSFTVKSRSKLPSIYISITGDYSDTISLSYSSVLITN